MSEFTNTKKERIKKLHEVSKLIIETGNAHSFIIENKPFISTVIPADFITLFDEIIQEGYDIQEIKVLTNKILNIFYVPIRDYKRIEPEPDSFLGLLEKNNHEMELQLNRIRPIFKEFVKDFNNTDHQNKLEKLFHRLEVFVKHYTIKENILFPVLEQKWPDFRCLKIMWSFHDDIRKNFKTITEQLRKREIDYKKFNKCVGDIFFNMLAIKFREERILFPHILDTVSDTQLEKLKNEGAEFGYPYFQPDVKTRNLEGTDSSIEAVNLGTGKISIEQIRLIFNHLPVDITFVDEHDKVCYFSTPAKRIFPRTTSIIGREVKNCHPPESVHVVEKIVESFRNGEKDRADFWIKMKGEEILIQYFAVRDEHGAYKGVIEVSQEISGIKALKGEKRLLDW